MELVHDFLKHIMLKTRIILVVLDLTLNWHHFWSSPSKQRPICTKSLFLHFHNYSRRVWNELPVLVDNTQNLKWTIYNKNCVQTALSDKYFGVFLDVITYLQKGKRRCDRPENGLKYLNHFPGKNQQNGCNARTLIKLNNRVAFENLD